MLPPRTPHIGYHWPNRRLYAGFSIINIVKLLILPGCFRGLSPPSFYSATMKRMCRITTCNLIRKFGGDQKKDCEHCRTSTEHVLCPVVSYEKSHSDELLPLGNRMEFRIAHSFHLINHDVFAEFQLSLSFSFWVIV